MSYCGFDIRVIANLLKDLEVFFSTSLQNNLRSTSVNIFTEYLVEFYAAYILPWDFVFILGVLMPPNITVLWSVHDFGYNGNSLKKFSELWLTVNFSNCSGIHYSFCLLGCS